MGDRIEVPLALTDFEVIGTELVDGVLEVEIRSTFTRACFQCGSTDVTGHGRCERRIRDVSFGYPTVLVWSQRRYKCRDCGRTSRERHPETLGAKRVTRRFRSRLADAACRDPWSDVASREAVSWWRVADAFDDRARSELGSWSGTAPRVVSLDEASFKQKFIYHTVLSAPEQRRILELTEGRSRQSARQALAGMPFGWRNQIETVVIDMFWPFRKAVGDVFGDQVRIVADKFHVLRAVDAAAQDVRIRHGRKVKVVGRDGGLARQHNPRFDKGVWNSRWLFMRRHHHLSETDRDQLDELFARHPDIRVAWLLKEAFAEIYNAADRTEAEQQLDLWVYHVEQSGLREFRNVWRTLSHWRNEILNYHDDRQTNAYAEGVTNTIKVLKRRGYGHRHPGRYRAKVLLHTANHRTDPPRIA